MPSTERQKVKVFISYAHDDEQYFKVFIDKLEKVLKPSPDFNFDLWDDRKLHVGELWDEAIQSNLANADLAILLVSDSFLASDYIKAKEFGHLIEKFPNTLIIPVLFAPCNFAQWDELAKKQFFIPQGDKYDKIGEENFSFASLVQLNFHKGAFVLTPNHNIAKYIGNLAKEIKNSYQKHIKKK